MTRSSALRALATTGGATLLEKQVGARALPEQFHYFSTAARVAIACSTKRLAQSTRGDVDTIYISTVFMRSPALFTDKACGVFHAEEIAEPVFEGIMLCLSAADEAH